MTVSSLAALAQGFGLGASLIIAIGAQNAFVLRQGIRRQRQFAIALTCSLSDAALITLGVAGLGTLIASIPVLQAVATWGGAAFLFFYGLRSFRAAIRPGTLEASESANEETLTLGRTIAVTLAFSWLNPHAILDTVVLIGSIGAGYPVGTRPFFAIGTVLASFVWFFGLSYGAGFLAPLFGRPVTWRVLDVAIGLVMWAIAGSLVMGALG